MTRPSLLLNFAATKQLDPRVTFTRSTIATYIDAFGVLKTATANTPRLDHDPQTGVCKGLQIEEARTNLLLRSEEFDNAAWSKTNATVTPNATTSPDGALSADTLVASVTGSFARAAQNISGITVQTYALTWYVKAGSVPFLHGTVEKAGAQTLRFNANLSSGVAQATTSVGTIAATASLQALPNSWWRLTLVVTVPETGTYAFFIGPANAYPSSNCTINDSIHVWGAQLEAGAFPTSYIPTTSATVTRAADLPSMTGSNFSSWYRQDEGTFVCRGSHAVYSGGVPSFWHTDNGTQNDRIFAGITGSSRQLVVVTSGATVASIGGFSPSADVAYNFAAAYRANDFAAVTNGGAVSTDTSGALPATQTVLRIGGSVSGSALATLNGHLALLAYYPVRLTAAQLQGLTL